MREGTEVCDLANEPDGRERVDPAHAPQPANDTYPRLGLCLFGDQRVEAIAARQQRFVAAKYSPNTTRVSESSSSIEVSHAR